MNSAFVQVLTAIAMVLTIVVPMTYYFKGEHNKNRYKKSLAANVSGFFGLLLIATVVSFAGATTASAATEAGAGLATGLGYIGAALVTGLSGIGSGIAVRHRKNIQIINILIVFFKTFISAQQHIFYLFAADNRLLFTCHIKSAPFFSAAAAQKGQ